MKTTLKGIIGIAACTFATATAFAVVRFNVTDGTGTISKSDVLHAFGWQPRDLTVLAAEQVRFSYESVDIYKVPCKTETTAFTVEVKIPRSEPIIRTVLRDVKNQPNGFQLMGWANGPLDPAGDAVPATGDPCPGNISGTVNGAATLSSSGTLYIYPNANGSGVALR